MKTRVLNADELAFDSVDIYLGKVCGVKHNKWKGVDSLHRLHMVRVIVVSENSTKMHNIWTRLGFSKPEVNVNVDLDIYLEDGTCVQINTSNVKLIKKLMKYVWELKADPRVKFYRKMSYVELNKEIWERTQL